MLARGLAARVGRLAHRRVASTATPASVVHRIELEPLTAEAFAPFGEICGTLSQSPPSLHVPGALTIYHTPFAADSPTNLLFIRYHDAPPLFRPRCSAVRRSMLVDAPTYRGSRSSHSGSQERRYTLCLPLRILTRYSSAL